MKKFFSFLAVIALCLLLTGCKKNVQTIEQITGVSFKDISYIKTGNATIQDNDFDVNAFINRYKKRKYKKTKGTIINNSQKYLVCYNANDEVILTVVEIDDEMTFIKKGSFDINKDASTSLYQRKK